jgi:CO/xanthine dehydrogenase FAD-binding subunit
LDDKELVTAVLIPLPEKDWREGFLKKSRRGSVDFAIAAMVEDLLEALRGTS